MAALSEETQYRVLLALGHHDSARGHFFELNDPRPDEYVDIIHSLLDDLDEVEAELRQARKRSMAIEIEGAKVDFAQQIIACRLRGGEIVNQLAHYVGLPIGWNRFGGSATKRTIVSQM